MNGNSKSKSAFWGDLRKDFFSIFLDSVVILIIFNNYREVRRRRQQEKNALEAKVQEMKKKDVEAEEWKRQKQFFYEKFWTFGLGLSMLVVAGSYYWMRGWDQTYINIITPSHISKEDEKNLTLEKTEAKIPTFIMYCDFWRRTEEAKTRRKIRTFFQHHLSRIEQLVFFQSKANKPTPHNNEMTLLL